MNTRGACILFIAMLTMVGNLQSQTALTVRVTDQNNKSLTYAIVKYRNSTLTTNDTGTCRISNYFPDSKIKIHKLGFSDTTISIDAAQITQPTTNATIVLRLKIALLPEVSINSSPIEEVNPMKADFVISYELTDDNLIELLSDDNMLVIDRDYKVKTHLKTEKGTRDIVKDPYGNISLKTDKRAYKINLSGPELSLDATPGDLIKLDWDLQYCDEVTEAARFIRRYKDNNQTVAFFAMSILNEGEAKLLKVITDEDRKEAVAIFANETRSLNQYLNDLGINKMTASTSAELVMVNQAQKMSDMLEMNYSLPSYSFLKRINNNVYLFAHDIDSMFIYDLEQNLIGSRRINYHHLKTWNKELILNEEKTKVYAKLVDHSKLMLAEIDLQTGTLKQPFITIGSRFAYKIKIRNEVAYYLAKQKDKAGYTIYAQKLH